MAVVDAVQSVAAAEKTVITEQYGGKLSNKFIEELKGATLFQFDWGELLSAAPTALSLMGSCWLAAANPTTEMISLADAVPKEGFKYMTNLRNPTLRACLVDGTCLGADAESRKTENKKKYMLTSWDLCSVQ